MSRNVTLTDDDIKAALFGPVDQPFTLVIPVLPLSWNKAMRMHFAVRERAFDAQKDAVAVAWKLLQNKPEPFSVPVEIEATAYFATRRFDADNCVWKPIIDSARGLLLINDSPVYVTRVISASKTDKANPRTELTFRPVEAVSGLAKRTGGTTRAGDPMTDHPTAGARPDVDAIEERLELSRSPECQVAGDADDQLIVFDIPDLIAYIRTLEAERDAAYRRGVEAAQQQCAHIGMQWHADTGFSQEPAVLTTVNVVIDVERAIMSLLPPDAGDSKAENTAGIAR